MKAHRSVIATLLLCAGYYASGMVAIELRFQPGGISGMWLPHGILLAAFLTAPVRRWWLYAAALLPTHLHLVSTFQGPVPPAVMLIQFGGNIMQAALGAAALRRALGEPPQLDTLPRMGAFVVVGAFLAPCLASALVTLLFVATGWVDHFWIAWQRRTFAGMCGAVILAAPVLYLATGGLAAIRRAPLRRIVEFVSLTAGLLALLLLPFAWEPARVHHQWLLFAPLPLLLWSTVRFGAAGLGLHLLAVALVILVNSQAGRGAFVAGSAVEIVLAVQGYLLTFSVPLMLLAALVRQHAQAAASLRRSQAQYQSVVEDQTEMICRFLADGTYTFVNGAYCRYFQRSADDLIGQKLWQFIPEDQQPASRAFLASITPDHPVASIEHAVTAPGGERRWHQWTDRGFFDERGRIIEYQAVGHDITERTRAEESQRQLVAQRRVAEALQEVDRRKDEFLAMLAHELRNPLASIVLATENLRSCAPADESVKWAREVIARQAGQLTRLVDDLLDVSRVTLGKITLNLSALDLRSVIAQAVEASQPLLTANRHELSVDVSEDPLPTRGDGPRLIQVISNLLNNAAKFTDKGGRIALSAKRVGAETVLRVADNGRGIPPHMLERVFEMFAQLEGPTDGAQDGLGIGLALVKRLVTMHDGTIEARSEGPGRGSELIVRLPIAIDRDIDAAVARAAGENRPPQGLRPVRILVVDDNVDAAEGLSRLLRLDDHEVLVAHDGLAGLETAQSMSPDVVLLDIGLPKLDGLEVARRLRKGSGSRCPLLVAMTGFGQARDSARTAAAGFDHHLTKPIDMQELQSLIRGARSASE